MQTKLSNRPADNSLLAMDKKLREKLNKESLIEESIIKQKSRDKHLNLGDSNSRYFYSLFKSNTRKNCINSIVDSEGNELNKKDAIEATMVSHFQSIMAPPNAINIEVQDVKHFNVANKIT